MCTTWKILAPILLSFALISSIHICCTQTANARPQYNKQFIDIYPIFKMRQIKVSCMVCHPEKNKKVHNNYGKAVKAELPQKNTKNKTAIIDAFKRVEDKPSDVPGKTFGDLIDEGILPNAIDK